MVAKPEVALSSQRQVRNASNTVTREYREQAVDLSVNPAI